MEYLKNSFKKTPLFVRFSRGKKVDLQSLKTGHFQRLFRRDKITKEEGKT